MEQFYQVVPYILATLVVAEAILLLYKYNRAEFDRIVLEAFLAVEKEVASETGQERMSVAVLKIINTLPPLISKTLSLIAAMMGTDLHGLTHELAQQAYNAFKALHPYP